MLWGFFLLSSSRDGRILALPTHALTSLTSASWPVRIRFGAGAIDGKLDGWMDNPLWFSFLLRLNLDRLWYTSGKSAILRLRVFLFVTTLF